MSNPFKRAQAEHNRRTRDWSGWCLVFVRTCFGVAPLWPDAATAWRNAKYRHPETDPAKIPRGAPIWWTGGRGGHGHVAIGRGLGSCWTTDLIRPGQVDVAAIEDVERRWGLQLVGWTEDVNGVRVYAPPKPKSERGSHVKHAQADVDKALQAPANKGKGNKLRALRRAAAWLRTIK